ncbi:hypothetical protein D3C72_392690 [compost metagenome]
MRAGQPRRLLDLGLRRAGAGIGDVLGQRAVKQHRVLLHDCDLAAQRRLLHLGDVLPVDGDAAVVHVVQALDQLDERGLARARMAHQADALSGRDARGEVLVQRRVVRAIAEGHVFKADFTFANVDGGCARTVGHAQRLASHRHQFFHVVDRALQVADVHAHVAQIALQHEEHRQGESDVAHGGLVARPQQQGRAQDGGLHRHQHRALDAAVQRGAHPGAAGAMAPLVHHAIQPRLFTRFRAKGLDHRVATDGVGQRAAHARVPGVAQARGRGHIAQRQRGGDGDIHHRTQAHHQAHQGPVRAQQGGGAHQHHHGRQQRDQQRVVQDVHGPHAARDLAHGGTREAVGMPVGGKALHAVEGVGHDPVHHLQGERDDVLEHRLAQQRAAHAQRHQQPEGRDGGVPGQRVAARARRHGVNQAAGIHRRQDIGHGRQQGQQHDDQGAPGLQDPMLEGKAQDVLEGLSSKVDFFSSHNNGLAAQDTPGCPCEERGITSRMPKASATAFTGVERARWTSR